MYMCEYIQIQDTYTCVTKTNFLKKNALAPDEMKTSWMSQPLHIFLIFPPSVFLLGKSHGERSLADYSSWGSERVRLSKYTTTTN